MNLQDHNFESVAVIGDTSQGKETHVAWDGKRWVYWGETNGCCFTKMKRLEDFVPLARFIGKDDFHNLKKAVRALAAWDGHIERDIKWKKSISLK